METPKSFGQALAQTGELLRGLSVPQRFLLAGGAVVVAVSLWVFVVWMSAPRFVVLYSGMKPEEAQQMASRLAAANISYQLSPDNSTVTVPSDQLDSARVKTASQGLPRNARLGFELFDTPNWAGSDFTEKVDYQRALEGELERTIESMSEVESVRVHIVLPTDSLFESPGHEAKAAVIVRPRASGLSEQARVAIPQLVASAVDRLRPENVTVVDADTNTPMLRARHAGDFSSPDLEQELGKKIVATLEPVVGAEHVRASVHVEYDSSSSEDTSEVYDPKASAALTQQKSEETADAGSPGGAVGTASNTPGTSPAAIALSSESQSSHSESATFAVSKDVRHVIQPAGRIHRVAAAVLVDDVITTGGAADAKTTRRKRTPEELKQIEQLAAAAIGLDPQRNDTLVVQNLSFQEVPAEQLSRPNKIQRARRIVVEWSGVLRYVAVSLLFLFIYLVMLRPIKQQILKAFRELPAKLNVAKKPGNTQLAAGEVQIELPEGSEQGRLAMALKRQVTEKVQSEPAAASRLVQNWIREDA